MYFVVFATDKPGRAQARAQARPAHREYLRTHSHPLMVKIAGPTFNDGGDQMNGTMLVVEASSIDIVNTFLKGDPYHHADLFMSVKVRPWSWGLGMPEE